MARLSESLTWAAKLALVCFRLRCAITIGARAAKNPRLRNRFCVSETFSVEKMLGLTVAKLLLVALRLVLSVVWYSVPLWKSCEYVDWKFSFRVLSVAAPCSSEVDG